MALRDAVGALLAGSADDPFENAAQEAIHRVYRDRPVDPLARLLNPDFTPVLWEYDHSHVGLEIPGNLHPKQCEAIETPADHWWLFWGNQTGKTTLGAITFALWALGRHPWFQPWEPPLTMWASGLTWELWQEILLPELLTWIPSHRIIDAPRPFAASNKRTITIRADNGTVSRIVGKAARQGRELYQSARIHAFWMDEEHPLSIWQEVLPRLVRFGGVTMGTMTPLLGMTWVYTDHYEPWKRGKTDNTFCSHAGMADNPGLPPEKIEETKAQYAGDPAQLTARLFGHFTRPSGLAIDFDPKKNLKTWTEDAIAFALRKQEWTQYCGIDFGRWRFGFVHLAVDHAKRSHVIGEYFSQLESLEDRAKWIHAHLDRHGAPDNTRIWGDSANPTDIHEINKEFARLGSPYRVRAVGREQKLRRASVTTLNNLFTRGALLVRRQIAEFQLWKLHLSAASDGRQMIGSRLLWEFNNWRFPPPKEPGVDAQKDDPDDDTADGADMIAALRYAVMSYYRPPKKERPPERVDPNVDTGLEELAARMERMQRLARYGG